MKHIFSLLLVVITALLPSVAEARIDSLSYRAEAMASVATGDHTPFWLVSNRNGLQSVTTDNGYVRAGVFKGIDHQKRFSWGAGADILGAWHFTSKFRIQQLYGELKWRSLGLMVGAKEGIDQSVNARSLSSGNLMFSGDAQPIPQARIGIPEYTVVPWTKRWLSVRGHVAYGMFTDDNWQRRFVGDKGRRSEDVWYHSKALFIKIGNLEKAPVWFEGSLEMAAQFKGRSISGNTVVNLSSGLKDFWKVFFPSGADSSLPEGEQTNVQGNHLGEWSAKLGWKINKDWQVQAYYNHYFEDHSMMLFDYEWRDGLWGVEIDVPRNPVISRFVYEYLYTKDQAGSVYNDVSPLLPEQVSGCDSYYNHGYYAGWQHWGFGIGNPLLLSPIFNTNGQITFRTTRVKGHHIGFEGQPFDQLSYRVLASYTRNWGNYGAPFKSVLRNYNGLLEVAYNPRWCPGAQAVLGLAADGGALLGRSFGVMLTLKKTGWL